MDFDKEKEAERISVMRSLLIIILLGISGISSPFISLYVATFKGISDLSMFNSVMLMILAILIIVFLFIKTFRSFINKMLVVFVSGIIFLCICLISLLLNLALYMGL